MEVRAKTSSRTGGMKASHSTAVCTRVRYTVSHSTAGDVAPALAPAPVAPVDADDAPEAEDEPPRASA
jgi:hypothetical protein